MSEFTVIKYEFAEKGAEKSIDEMILKTAMKIHNIAVNLAPKDKGQLQNSIMWKITNSDGQQNTDGMNSKGGEQTSKRLEETPKTQEGHVGSNLEYATYQEFGTKRMAAQPFLRPAGDRIKGATAQEIMAKYGKDAMQKEYMKRKKKVIKS